ncbi:MAG: hypothetical protein PUC26_05780 [Eubacteriales bacterium]|jgi:hypothetical protein|nr:hypothetical protein [Eubacteriales bacterium]
MNLDKMPFEELDDICIDGVYCRNSGDMRLSFDLREYEKWAKENNIDAIYAECITESDFLRAHNKVLEMAKKDGVVK